MQFHEKFFWIYLISRVFWLDFFTFSTLIYLISSFPIGTKLSALLKTFPDIKANSMDDDFHCDSCNKSYRSGNDLKKHIQTVHTCGDNKWKKRSPKKFTRSEDTVSQIIQKKCKKINILFFGGFFRGPNA